MNAKQLIATLEKIHPDFQDQDLIVMSINDKGENTYELLAGAGILVSKELSFAVLTTENSVRETVKKRQVVDSKTNRRLTEEDLKNMINKT